MMKVEQQIEDLKSEHAKEIKRFKEIIQNLNKEIENMKLQLQSNKCAECGNKMQTTVPDNKRGKISVNEEDITGLMMSKGFISHHNKLIEQLNQVTQLYILLSLRICS